MVKTLLALSLKYLLNILRKMLDIILLHFTVDKEFYLCFYCTALYWNSIVQFATVRYCEELYGTVRFFTVLQQYCTVLYCTVLYCTVLCCTVLYCSVLCCTLLFCTVL